jgi:NAD(P)-dependent dehydrogenase (short-subunit alcohol dehydrogenase family)
VNLFTSFNILKSSIKAMVAGDAQSSSSNAGSSSSSPSHGNAAKHRGAGGSVVLVSAALASHGIPNYDSMSAAKAGVEGEGSCWLEGQVVLHMV